MHNNNLIFLNCYQKQQKQTFTIALFVAFYVLGHMQIEIKQVRLQILGIVMYKGD